MKKFVTNIRKFDINFAINFSLLNNEIEKKFRCNDQKIIVNCCDRKIFVIQQIDDDVNDDYDFFESIDFMFFD